MLTFERIQVAGHIGSCTPVKGKFKDFYKITITPGSRKIRGVEVKVWYNVVISADSIRDRTVFESMYVPGRMLIAEGVPTPEAFTDRSGELRAEITISAKSLPILLDSASKAQKS